MANIYRLSQIHNQKYDTYDSVIVVADTEEEAVLIHPAAGEIWYAPDESWNKWDVAWASAEHLTVELVGTTELTSQVLLASFNAG